MRAGPVHSCDARHRTGSRVVDQTGDVVAYGGGKTTQPGHEVESFDAFYDAHVLRVRGLARRILTDADRAEDVAQEALLRAFRQGIHRDTERDPWPWLASVTYRLAVDGIRRRTRVREIPLDQLAATLPPAVDDVETVAGQAWQRAGVRDALGALRTKQRRVLEARYGDGMRCREIADAEGMTVDAVKSTLVRARRAFRVHYGVLSERRGLGVAVLLPALRYRLSNAWRRLLDRGHDLSFAPCRSISLVEAGAGVLVIGAMTASVAVLVDAAVPGSPRPDATHAASPTSPSAESSGPAAAPVGDPVPAPASDARGRPLPVEGLDRPDASPRDALAPETSAAVELTHDPDEHRGAAEHSTDVEGDGSTDSQNRVVVQLRCPESLAQGTPRFGCDAVAGAPHREL